MSRLLHILIYCITASATFAGQKPDFKQFRDRLPWIWQPPRQVEPPKVKYTAWPTDVIDHFVLRKLEVEKLKPAGPANDRVWIRRVYFAITGLPPKPEDIQTFLNDTSKNRKRNLVRALLDSPHYGERWARHWMDLVRYAESRGHEEDSILPNAYRYRDYLIRAFNTDLPYDTLVIEHLAGDLLGNPRLHPETGTNESILATGWPFFGEMLHAPVNLRQDQCDRLDNKVDVMSKTFLGLTVACARCHDHKFDAISQSDYYAMAGFILSSSYRQARFESMEQNKSVAKKLEGLRQDHLPKIAKAFAAAARPVVDALNYDVPVEPISTPLPRWTRLIMAVDPGSQGEAWAKLSFDHAKWKTMKLPGHFENAGLPGYDGVVWFRKTIELSAGQAKAKAVLNLGQIDDMDVTWVNGSRVGGYENPGHHYTVRKYPVPTGLLKAGKNTIAVRVMDHGWPGGIAGKPEQLSLQLGKETISLANAWHFSPGSNLKTLNEQAALVRPELVASAIYPVEGKHQMVADYTQGHTPWLVDGPTFGRSPALPGQLMLVTGDQPLALSRNGGAIRDAFWNRLKNVDSENDPGGLLSSLSRAGKTIRTPTVTLTSGQIYYLIRGKATVYAAVSQNLFAGPLHGTLAKTVEAKGDAPQWIGHNLKRYVGQRVHFEISPVGDAPFELLQVIDGGTPKQELGEKTKKPDDFDGIVIDNPDAKVSGLWDKSDGVKNHLGSEYLHTRNPSSKVVYPVKFAKGGKYEVRISFAHHPNRSTKTLVTIRHNHGEKSFRINQKKEPAVEGYFQSLGFFEFQAGQWDAVEISAVGSDGSVVADAVQFLPEDTKSSMKKKKSVTRKELHQALDDLIDGKLEARHIPHIAWLLKDGKVKLPDELLKSWQSALDDLAKEARWESRLAVSWWGGTGVDEHILERGSPQSPGERIGRNLPELLAMAPLQNRSPGRLELARQLTKKDHPLTSRVMVNRIWHQLFGRGIVSTPDNFGWLGQRPSHPDLLDYLAVEFAETHSHSIKSLIERIVLTKTFGMSSTATDPVCAEKDSDNRWLHRMPLRRLEAEAIRDSALAISGRLDRTVGGKPVLVHLTEFVVGRGGPKKSGPLDGAGRRSIYTALRRNFIPTLMLTFDFPAPFTTVGKRDVTNVAGQGLALMNDRFLYEQSSLWAGRIIKEQASAPERIRQMYAEAFARLPSDGELASCLESLTAFTELYRGDSNSHEAWRDLCHSFYSMNDFIYLK